MAMSPDDFRQKADTVLADNLSKFRSRIKAAEREAYSRGQSYFTVSSTDLPVSLGTGINHPFEQVLNEWRQLGWTITTEPSGCNEHQLVFHPTRSPVPDGLI